MTTSYTFSIDAMKKPAAYSHATHDLRLIETHISWVILAGDFVYKFKKPITTPFLDYGSLELRRVACYEELRLNRRYSPEIYLDVVPIVDRGGHLHVANPIVDSEKSIEGPIVEYAVRMRRFDDHCLLSDMLENQRLTMGQIELLADELAEVHLSASQAPLTCPWGSLEELEKESQSNFRELREISGGRFEDTLAVIEDWEEASFRRLHTTWHQRRLNGHIRECHGDLHLGNLVWHNQRVALFDAIEFNEAFRWIDTMSDLAFVLMDLEDRGRVDFAGRLLNRYLEKTGDYEGLAVLDWFMVYRAMVRAKVGAIKASQETVADRADEDWLRVEEYVLWARRMTHPRQIGIVITHGLSGSGKTSGTEPLISTGRAVRVRSDVERKRDDDVETSQSSEVIDSTNVDHGIYRAENIQSNYLRLLQVAREIVEGGYWAIVDATFLESKNRDSFARLARELQLPFYILPFHADFQTLSARIEKRRSEGIDPSDATIEVLQAQQARMQPLGERELQCVVDLQSLSRQMTGATSVD